MFFRKLGVVILTFNLYHLHIVVSAVSSEVSGEIVMCILFIARLKWDEIIFIFSAFGMKIMIYVDMIVGVQ
jgi:hypothetical protein